MLLIDAANVSGGGAVLLTYLVDQLVDRGLPFHVLKKPTVTLNIPEGNFTNVSVSLFNRGSGLRSDIRRVGPTTILCFGNFPPPFATGVRTITYFHNLHCLSTFDRHLFSLRDRLKLRLRRAYLQVNRCHSDLFVVQTPYVQDGFMSTFGLGSEQVRVIPFYDEAQIQRVRMAELKAESIKQANTFLYASSAEPHKNHITLLRAWALLHQQGFLPTLYLTIAPGPSNRTKALLHRIDRLKKQGVLIENKGNMAYGDLLRLTYACSACIFPSVNETIGLGLLDSYWMSNDILASRRPYLSHIVRPSADFDPYDPQSIADAVQKSMAGTLPKPAVVLTNQLDAFINLLYPATTTTTT